MNRITDEEIEHLAECALGRAQEMAFEIRDLRNHAAALLAALKPFALAANEMGPHRASLRIYLPGNTSYGDLYVEHFRTAAVAHAAAVAEGLNDGR